MSTHHSNLTDAIEWVRRYEPRTGTLVDEPFHPIPPNWRQFGAQRGIAHAETKFAEGVERVVFQCSECVSYDGGASAFRVGPRLVAKQAKYLEHMRSDKFHRTFLRTQCGCPSSDLWACYSPAASCVVHTTTVYVNYSVRLVLCSCTAGGLATSRPHRHGCDRVAPPTEAQMLLGRPFISTPHRRANTTCVACP